MIIIRTWFARAIFHALLFVLLPAFAQEHIQSFDSFITIHTDGTIDVREVISVNAQLKQIQRGIVREFPTSYNTGHGLRYNVPFVVKRVLRDGKPEQYSIRDLSNGQAVYIGNPNTLLTLGTHTFEILYQTDRQIGFFKDHDELYWNVTGNGWRLPIRHVTAHVQLPAALTDDQIDFVAYTGPKDATGADFQAGRTKEGLVWFKTTRPFNVFEGLTIAVKWPKGIVHEPTTLESARNFLRDNLALLWGLFGTLILLAYCIIRSIKLRRQNALGTIIPLFHPPEGVSPAQAGTVAQQTYSDELFAAQIVQLAVKGYIDIECKEKSLTDRVSSLWRGVSHVYILKKKTGKEDLNPDEQALYTSLFGMGRETIKLDGKEEHREYVRGAQIDLRSRVVQWLERYIDTHSEDIGIASVLAAAVFLPVIIFWIQCMPGDGMGLYILLLLAGLIPYVIVHTITHMAWMLLGLTVALLSQNPCAILITITSCIVWYFARSIRGFTDEGKKLIEKIEGFKLFLTAAEVNRMEYVGTPPVRTPELYETCLPYAIALGVEKQWTDQFAPVFKEYAQSGKEYVPRWYVGPRTYLYAGSMGSDMRSAVASTAHTPVSSSSSSPGSGSGFGGGGRSGGGGGGGGGGGW